MRRRLHPDIRALAKAWYDFGAVTCYGRGLYGVDPSLSFTTATPTVLYAFHFLKLSISCFWWKVGINNVPFAAA
jgi:hypothetical protein